MARRRMIDPGIWDSEQVQSLSCRQFKVYVYAFSMADDEGRLKLSWPLMPARVHPVSEEDRRHFREDVAYLQAIGLVEVYAVNGCDYLMHPNWHKFQKLDHPSKYSHPAPDHGIPVDLSREPRESLARVSREPRETIASDSEPVRASSRESRRNELTKRREDKIVPSELPARPPAVRKTNGVDPGEDSSLYQQVKAAFEAKHGDFSNYGREGKAILRLINKAKRLFPEDAGAFLANLCVRFWALKQGPDRFWQEQPFTPSSLDALFDRVAEHLRSPPEQTPVQAPKFTA